MLDLISEGAAHNVPFDEGKKVGEPIPKGEVNSPSVNGVVRMNEKHTDIGILRGGKNPEGSYSIRSVGGASVDKVG